MTEIKLPGLKENVEVVEVNAVLVSAGDEVAKDQPLLEVQADKAALDVPSPVAGRVGEIRVKAGDQVKVGQVFCVIEEGGGDGKQKPAKGEQAAKVAAGKTSAKSGESTVEKRADEPRPKERPKEEPPAETPARQVPAAEQPAPSPRQPVPQRTGNGPVVLAGPATRRLAREFGVDLSQVHGSGRHGRVTQDDVKVYVREIASGGAAPAAPPGAAPAAPTLPRFEDFGPLERESLSKVRRLTAQQVSLAWTTIPHVTQHDEADITDLETFRKSRDGKGPKLTVTAFALKAAAIALKQFPHFNASLDLANNQLVLKGYYHIGVAVDTERGLVVPVVRDVDKKSIEALATELTETADKARKGQFDMTGGTFTISNLGGIGGTAFTPIVNWPEVAILGLSRSRWQPTVRDGQVTPRLILPLSLSYDHRALDGAAAARFTRFLAEMLENPLVMLLKT
ncbi:MAG: 2-oxo acid dehydrogenase subunit E2 [Planctomycetes bacterium]|nr:2-oxo acid dehydrogenase subunit E2 [Planctomycetota bacterium]